MTPQVEDQARGLAEDPLDGDALDVVDLPVVLHVVNGEVIDRLIG